MSQKLSFDLTPEQAIELQALLKRCVQEVRAADERMEQAEAERLRMQAETCALLQQLREMLQVKDHC